MRVANIFRASYLLMALLATTFFTTKAWVSHHPNTLLSVRSSSSPSATVLKEGGPLGFLSPYESKIPEELKDEIYAAEANTPAARDRGQRVALYAVIAFTLILCAFFNGFLTELRSNGPDGTAGVDLTEAGFGWVLDNFLFQFLFTNKIGGGICLLGGAGSGLLAEAELDTKRINAEKIYEELVRRKEAKQKKKRPSSSSKKRRSGKEKKRLVALSEVVIEEEKTSEVPVEKESEESSQPAAKEEEPAKDEKKGIFGAVKDFYEKADNMAASQALMLNKQLEDAGVVGKITDETGLKVIGKEEAAKLKAKQDNKQD